MAGNDTIQRGAANSQQPPQGPKPSIGCAVIEPDEEDVCSWFVKLLPLWRSGARRPSARFSDRGLPPTVSVLQPRLVAPFILSGALCARATSTMELTEGEGGVAVDGCAQHAQLQ